MELGVIKPKAKCIIAAASEIAGSVAGAGLGLVVLGPAGALGGAALSPVATRVISRTCLDVYDRITGRGAARATAAAAFAATKIQQRLAEGERLRDDGFFDDQVVRSSADEVLEGIMLKCRDEHEEQKARYYGNLFASAATNERYTVGYLNRALSVLDNLTYQQLCLLRIFSDPDHRSLRAQDYTEVEATLSNDTVNVLDQLHDLIQRSLAHRAGPPGSDPETLQSSIFIMDPFQIAPTEIRLTRLGSQLCGLLQLQDLPDDDLRPIETHLS
jgi:hypothetical protein